MLPPALAVVDVAHGQDQALQAVGLALGFFEQVFGAASDDHAAVVDALARVDAGTFRCRCELQPEQSVLMEQPSQVANATRQWDYYRVPKSGSTAVEAILRAWLARHDAP